MPSGIVSPFRARYTGLIPSANAGSTSEVMESPMKTTSPGLYEGFNEGYISELLAGTTLGDIDLYALWGPEYSDVRYVDENGVSRIAHANVLYGGVNGSYPGGV